jgi:predicted amidohydrolase
MRDLVIACCQFEAVPEAKEANIARMIHYAHQARYQDSELILYPELIVTGYLAPDQIAPLAEPVAGPSVERLARAARKLNIALAFGFAELDVQRNVCHNSLVILDRSGQVAGVYRKIHLWDSEKTWAKPGREVPVFVIDGVRYSGWICYDTRFPEVARASALQGADVALVPTAWLGPVDEWHLALRARALDNSFYVAGADIINPEPQLRCRGASMIAGPKGEVLAQSELGQEGIICARLSDAPLTAQRKRVALLANRRPDLI